MLFYWYELGVIVTFSLLSFLGLAYFSIELFRILLSCYVLCSAIFFVMFIFVIVLLIMFVCMAIHCVLFAHWVYILLFSSCILLVLNCYIVYCVILYFIGVINWCMVYDIFYIFTVIYWCFVVLLFSFKFYMNTMSCIPLFSRYIYIYIGQEKGRVWEGRVCGYRLFVLCKQQCPSNNCHHQFTIYTSTLQPPLFLLRTVRAPPVWDKESGGYEAGSRLKVSEDT